MSKEANFYCTNTQTTPQGSSFTVINDNSGYHQEFQINMPGDFNILNALCAITHAKNLGISDENIQKGLSKTKIPGRMEVFTTKNTTAIVDYAHNFISYQCLFRSLKNQYPSKKIVVVGGCPGNKSYTRRIDFANALSLYADFAYITTDDPAFENFYNISTEIIANLSQNFNYTIIEDRALAIETAHANCDLSSILVIVGKGDDCYQRVFGKLIPYESDTKIVRSFI